MKQAMSVAIIGSGPRGMSVLERLATRLIERADGEAVDIYLMDDGHVGTGRVWATRQSPYLLMNTVAQEISAFSGQWDGKEARPGNGPSFAQWWQLHREDYAQYGGYGPRAYYGEYLLYVLTAIERALPAHIALHKISARVDRLEEAGEVQRLHFSDGRSLQADRTVLATGHSTNQLQGLEKSLHDYASRTPGLSYIAGDSAADMDFSAIKPGQRVGIIGMGLAFYDLVAELTLGRGGRFVPEIDGSLRYCPSGREPRIYAGSRSGMPVPARGRNQKPYDYEYEPTIFTQQRAFAMRKRGEIHFNRDVLPLLEAEITLMYAETKLRHEKGEEQASRLRKLVLDCQVDSVEGVSTMAHRLGLSHPIRMDLYSLANPFKGCIFPSSLAFHEALQDVLAADYAEAMHGNVDSPVKAALDVIRNSRSVIRAFVDFGGLHPASHQKEFLERFAPVSSFLSAGPPAFRNLQLQALIRAGMITIIGPSIQCEPATTEPAIYMFSPVVQHSKVAVEVIIDGRVPVTDITRDCASLTQSLLHQGIYVPFVNVGHATEFETGGVAVTASPFHPIRANQSIADKLYVLGIPTEHTRWFMQSGSSRPHKWIDFMMDADAIAADIIQGGQYAHEPDKARNPAIASSISSGPADR